mmetsp:Transcript_62747/g.86266  ORF Transcript_62747/g.86266 Transcript_62747/m.86266 type:complete len:240 (-) Transcript_62747:396-1115(-)|eukprot:CAMPEP_0185767398 /NCGR_PEP_ID=MMETSP1174-20130828/42930_1 /TAXON_ID=35687 /ORGANISM="Dictyocha speculum, Strain CCMP1381" /LENGTH=239 /DNA_ID=CAMNT_0028451571 /DNA_START=33 /DNA_END=752 /DNA_ORIENTATION=+
MALVSRETENGTSGEDRVFLEALPYIDKEYDDPMIQAKVQSLIESEMANIPPKDYLSHLPVTPFGSWSNSGIFVSEMQRIAAQERTMPMDLSRYEVPHPAKELHRDPQAWRTAVNNARAAVEHQHNRLVNLELLQRYGARAWLQQNKALDKIKTSIDKQKEEMANAISEVNLKRKRSQEKLAPRMAILQNDYRRTCHENLQLGMACALLRKDVKRLKEASPQPEATLDAENIHPGAQGT